ncbi:MAG: UBP-type zinc finger domain-containing protein [Solirubrobacteraceae bacterium]
MAQTCSHLDTIQRMEGPPDPPVCPHCVAIGSRWVHLRRCTECGHVGCCDDSPNRHATAHYHATGHPIIRSLEPGEEWLWCYEDELMFVLRDH